MDDTHINFFEVARAALIYFPNIKLRQVLRCCYFYGEIMLMGKYLFNYLFT